MVSLEKQIRLYDMRQRNTWTRQGIRLLRGQPRQTVLHTFPIIFFIFTKIFPSTSLTFKEKIVVSCKTIKLRSVKRMYFYWFSKVCTRVVLACYLPGWCFRVNVSVGSHVNSCKIKCPSISVNASPPLISSSSHFLFLFFLSQPTLFLRSLTFISVPFSSLKFYAYSFTLFLFTHLFSSLVLHL